MTTEAVRVIITLLSVRDAFITEYAKCLRSVIESLYVTVYLNNDYNDNLIGKHA